MLTVEGVSKRYGEKLVLRDISFTLAPGTITLVAGANGSGKSTLLRLMAGLLRPDSGAVTCKAAPGKIGFLGHQTLLYPDLTALENLAFWQKLGNGPAEEPLLLATLERMGLSAHAREKAGTFSRGMAQRLSLARVLLAEPQCLLLDEPGTGLDAASLALLHAEIAAAGKKGAAVAWVSHSLQADLPLADAVLFLHKKRLAWQGPAADFPAGGPEIAPQGGR